MHTELFSKSLIHTHKEEEATSVIYTGVKRIRGQWSPFYYNACVFFFLNFGDANKGYLAFYFNIYPVAQGM